MLKKIVIISGRSQYYQNTLLVAHSGSFKIENHFKIFTEFTGVKSNFLKSVIQISCPLDLNRPDDKKASFLFLAMGELSYPKFPRGLV